MSGFGRTGIVHIRGTSGNLADVTTGNAFKVDGSFRRKINLGKFQLSATEYTQLPNCPCGVVQIRSKEGNDLVYVGGRDQYLVDADIDTFLMETELRSFIVQNSNELSLIATTEYNEVIVDAYTNEDVDIERSDPPPPDLTAPTVSSHFPTPSGTTNIEWNTLIYAIFSEELHDDCITNANITISPAITYTVSKDSIDPLKVNIIPAAALSAATLYTVTLTTNLKDKAKIPNFLAAPFVFTFTTKAAPPPPDNTAPTVASTSPVDNDINVALSVTPAISFSEDLNDSTVTANTNVKAFVDSTNAVQNVASVTHSADGKTITLTLASLTYSTKYRIELKGGASGIKDLAGNFLASDYTFRFTTLAAATPTIWTLSGNADRTLYSGNYTRIKAVVKTSQSYLYGKKIIEWTIELAKVGSPTGNVTIVILNSSNSVLHTFSESKSAASLTTSYAQYTLHSPANSITMQVGYKIAVVYTGGNSSNYVKYRYANNSTYNSTNTIMQLDLIGFDLDYEDADVAGTMKAAA